MADPSHGELTRLGSFEIVRHLARGGMADIYLARGGDKLVVLKRILPTHAENPRFVKLFLDEAKLAMALDHPHIARVFELGTVDGSPFFTMEFVHGQDLRATLRRTDRVRKKFPLAHALGIAHDMADALHYAHERRDVDGKLLDIVHRDVSPSNVLVSYDGVSKLVDFGVAKAATSSVKTRTGTLKGKISYMSPEQARGAPVDRRSDVFALGIVLWEMITTRRLFRADNDLATIQMIINEPVPRPSEIRPDCPPELEAIAMRALARKADERYATAAEMRAALDVAGKQLAANTSPVLLAREMRELFAPELDAWTEAQASGMTLLQHVVKTGTDVTSPISESEVEFADSGEEEIEELLDDEDVSAVEAEAPMPVVAPVAPPAPVAPVAPAPPPAPPAPPVVAAPLVPMPPVLPEETVSQASAFPDDADEDAATTASPPLEIAPEDTQPAPRQATETPFPVAPMEWRPLTDPVAAEPPTDFFSRHRTQIFYVTAGVIAAMLIAAIALAITGAGKARVDQPPSPISEPDAP